MEWKDTRTITTMTLAINMRTLTNIKSRISSSSIRNLDQVNRIESRDLQPDLVHSPPSNTRETHQVANRPLLSDTSPARVLIKLGILEHILPATQ